MLEFPSQPIESMLLWQPEGWESGVMTYRPSCPPPVWWWESAPIQLQVANPSLAAQPGRPACQPPNVRRGKFLAPGGWNEGCLSSQDRAAVKAAAPGLSPASPLNLGSDLETCRLPAAAVWFLLFCRCCMARANLSWLCHAQDLASSNPGASSPSTYHPLGMGAAQVCAW